MTGKAEDRESFRQQPPAGGNDAEDKKGLANRGVNEVRPEAQQEQPGSKQPKR